MKNKILQEFLDSNIKIKNLDVLHSYIDYCLDNNQQKIIKSKSSYHHILPKALFEQYSILKDNPWNGSHLLYSDHYYAHWLLTEAIDDYGQLHAFCSMHNMDFRLGRIDEDDLIPKEEFQLKMEERSESQIERGKQLHTHNGVLMSRDQSRGKAVSESLTKTFIDENGLETTRAKQIGAKAAETIDKEYIDEDGNVTTGRKELAKVFSATVLKEYKNEDGNVTTIALEIGRKTKEAMDDEYVNDAGDVTTARIESNKKHKETKFSNGKFFDIYSDETLLIEGVSQVLLYDIYFTFTRKTKEKPIANTTQEEAFIIKTNKTYLYKLYVRPSLLKNRYSKDEIIRILSTSNTTKIKKYNICRGDAVIYSNLFAGEVVAVNQKLLLKTKDSPLGKSKVAKQYFINNNKEHLIGLYSEEIINER